MEHTRYARVQPSVAPLRNATDSTQVPRRLLQSRTLEALFSEKQRVMASATQEEGRPGLMIFAAHERFGDVGRLWLEASEIVRGGSLGRHDAVDLALPLDESLSLRHALFIVRRVKDGVRFTVLDLEATDGLALEDGTRVRLVEAEGMLILKVAKFTLFCLPTGQPVPWRVDAPRPWNSLLPRVTRRIICSATPGGRCAGIVEVTGRCPKQSVRVSDAALSQGVLLGRDARCAIEIPNQTVSRVHAVLLQLEGGVFLVDAGSTNGLWMDAAEVRAVPMRDGTVVDLWDQVSVRWTST